MSSQRIYYEIVNLKFLPTDYDWAVYWNRPCLDAIGLWADEKTNSISESKKFRGPFIAAWIIICFSLPMNYSLVRVIGDLSLVSDNLNPNLSTINALFKILTLWINRGSKF